MAKAILYKSKKLSDGTHPIVIRWYENGKQRVFTVGSCTEGQWSADKSKVKKNHPFYQQINNKIDEHLGNAILNGGIMRIEQEGDSGNIIEFVEELGLKSERAGKLAQKDKYRQLEKDLLDWKPSIKKMNFDNFKKKDVDDFYFFLLSDKKNNSKNTAARKMSRLGTVFKSARIEGFAKSDPFLGKTFERERVIKKKLTREQVELIEDLEMDGATKGILHARDAFIMQFYLRGLRIGDVLSLTEKDIDNGRIVIEENKTGKIRSIPIRPEVQQIIERHRGESPYLLPILKFRYDKKKTVADNELLYKKSIEASTAAINTNLKKIGKELGISINITTHIARHSFAKIAIDTVKNIRISQELLGHSSLRVHQDYIRDLEDNDELDSAAEDIYG
jgi:integrase